MWKIEPPLKNFKGKLSFANISTLNLAKQFGTPLFVTDSEQIILNYNKLYSAFSSHYDKFKINYAVKANNNLSILKLFNYLGSGVDCSCPEEILLAKKIGFKNQDMLYTGNYNSNNQLDFALKQKIMINVDIYTHILLSSCRTILLLFHKIIVHHYFKDANSASFVINCY